MISCAMKITGLDPEGLNWVPTEGANSISTIVTHLVGSEAETIRTVAGLPSGRISRGRVLRRDANGAASCSI